MSDFDAVYTTLGLGHLEGSTSFDATIRRPDTHKVAENPHLPRVSFGVESSGNELPELAISGVLGEGGMGRVHLAFQRSIGREVAVKTVRPEVANAKVAELLVSEARIAGRLEHPNVIPIHTLGLDYSGQPVLVMKRIEGVPWRRLLRDPTHPLWREIHPNAKDRLEANLEILIATTHAVDLAHRRGIVHRDIKPENVMVGAFGEVYLVDWGVALELDRASGETGLVGTPGYLAPEMVSGEFGPVGPKTDVYLLGATLHEVLTGNPPHEGENLYQVCFAAYQSHPPKYDLSIPSELAEIARRAMARDVRERTESARAFRESLRGFLRHRGAAELAEIGHGMLDEMGSGNRSQERLAECRFAFMQSLREWPEGPRAQEGLERLNLVEAEVAVARKDLPGAREIVKRMKQAPPAILRSLETLENELLREASRIQSLEAIAAGHDLSIGARAGGLMVGLLLLSFLVALNIYVALTGGYDLTPKQLVMLAGSINVAILLLGYWKRKSFLGTASGRRSYGIFLWATVGLLGHRLIGLATGASVEQILPADLVVISGIIGAAGIATQTSFMWSSAVFAAGAALTAFLPEYTWQIFATSGVLGAFVAAVIWRRLAEGTLRTK